MDWIGVALVIFSLLGNLRAQRGYNYPTPDRQFPSTQSVTPSTSGGGYPAGAPGQPEAPSTQLPNGYPSRPGFPSGYPAPGRPTGTQFPQGPQGAPNGYPRPGVTTSSRPLPGGPSGTPPGVISQQHNGYPTPSRPFQPSGLYPAPSQGSSDFSGGAQNGNYGPSTKPLSPQAFPETGIFPGAEQPGGPSGEGGITMQGAQPTSFPGQDQFEEGDYSAIPGEPDKDYPIFSYIPETSFSCNQQQYPGYYADIETRCQVFHICANNRTFDFLCPNGTIFHQEHLVCVWWNQFDCNSALSLYGVNANIYDYSIVGAQQPQGGYQPGQGAVGPQGYLQGVPGDFTTTEGGGPATEQGMPAMGYPNEMTQRPGGPSGGAFPPQAMPTGPGGNGYPLEQPQSPSFPTAPGRPAISNGYPSGRPQNGYPSGRPGFPTTQRPGGQGGYPQQTGFPTQQQRPGIESTSYPSGKPQGPGFPAGLQEQGGGYPSNGNGAQRPGHSSNIPQGENTNGYPSGRPQGPGFPPMPQGSFQRPGDQQGGYPQGPSFPTTIQPSTGVATTQGPGMGGYPGVRPGTPFPGTSRPQEPTREYLPPF